MEQYLYFGNLGKNERQFSISNYIGLALHPSHDREIRHNALDPLPFEDNLILKIQSQDVFEHLPYDSIPCVLDEIYRVLRHGGIFRLSVPDYRAELLKRRSVYDHKGNVIGDTMMGAHVSYDAQNKILKTDFSRDGNAHLWFPKYELLLDLIIKSKIRFCKDIVFYQYYINDDRYVCEPIPENEMYVLRCSPNDARSNGKPISIVVDFIK
jgi:SAM-dependent methyltransferase